MVIINTYAHKNINTHKKVANCLTLIRVTAPQQPVASQHDTNQEQLSRSERTDIMRPRTGGGEEDVGLTVVVGLLMMDGAVLCLFSPRISCKIEIKIKYKIVKSITGELLLACTNKD